MIVAVALGIGAALAVGFAALSGDRRCLFMALLIAAMWAIANVSWLFNRLDLLPLMDLGLGAVALSAYLRNGDDWAARILVLCYLRLGAHLVDYMTESQHLVAYLQGLNALFLLLLLAVAQPGVGNGSRLLRRLLDHHRVRALRTARRAQEATQ